MPVAPPAPADAARARRAAGARRAPPRRRVVPPLPVVPPVPELPLFWSTIVPVIVGLVLCGVRVSVFAETQYEYCVSPASPEIVSTLPAVV